MRLAFLGTPAAASTVLEQLVAAGHDVAVVVTRPDKRRGRGSERSPSPVKASALELGLAVTSRPDDVLDAQVDLGVVVAYGRLLKPPLLGAVPLVNLHFSLLPRWRGAAPVERAILAGDTETGVCLMELDEGLDTGGVYAAASLPIGPDDTAEHLREELSRRGGRLLVERLAGGADGLGEPRPQTGTPTYAAKIDPSELRLDWQRPALELHRVVRVGRAWTIWRGRRLLVLEGRPEAPSGRLQPGQLDGEAIGTGSGVLRLVRVQPEGRRAVAAVDWVRGARPQPGERLGAEQ